MFVLVGARGQKRLQPPSPFLFVCACLFPQHQQQVAQAVDRAKQVTMTELNAIIGVRGVPNLPLTVCITPLFLSFTYHKAETGLHRTALVSEKGGSSLQNVPQR